MQILESGRYIPWYSTPEFSFTITSLPLISLRNDDGSFWEISVATSWALSSLLGDFSGSDISDRGRLVLG